MKSFSIACLLLWGLLFPNIRGDSQNILTDGSFATTNSITPYYTGPEPLNIWSSWVDAGTNVAIEVTADDVCKYTIYNGGSESWFVQLNQWGFALEQNYAYRLTFDVKADAPRNFGVFIGESGGSWTNLNPNRTQQASTDWQTKTIVFDAYQVFTLHKLSFEMGGTNGVLYFDNIVLEKTGPSVIPNIDIIGSSVPPYDWSMGVNMQTTDGVHYMLANYTLLQGELKFRQDQNWSINWGAATFPKGIGYQDGPNIPVMAGTYDISFNRLTGEYNFYCPTCPPAIGIIGSAVPPYNWQSDVKMTTTDGIHYSLTNYALAGGELRFRQDEDWNKNWGGLTFPTGIGDITAPNIQIPAGAYNIHFNRLSAAYQFELIVAQIGILGSALNGWNDDIDMQTTDGINYILVNQAFTNGEVKFRQDNAWNINWGDLNFPWGTGYQNGPNIPIAAGNYTVHFNRIWGNYYFELICPDPVLVCPENIVVSAAANMCGAMVTYTMPMPAVDCGMNYVYQIEGLPSGAIYPVGITTNTFGLYNTSSGKFTTCSFTVTVVDDAMPVISDANTSVTSLWPANHKMVEVAVNYQLSDNCIIVDSSITVSSNEPENALGDGDASPDWTVVNHHLVQLRAERSGTGKGRIYTITISATDASGNFTSKTMNVLVPHDAAAKKGSVDINAANNGDLKATVTPNPSAHYFTLQIGSNSAETISIKVLDMSGRMLRTLHAEKNQTIRFGDDLKPGMYMVEITQGTQKTMCRILKQ